MMMMMDFIYHKVEGSQGSRAYLAGPFYNDITPDGTKPLPEPMLNNDQRGIVAFT